MGALCENYHWPPDFWRARPGGGCMGWREFRGWLRELNASRRRQAGTDRTSADSWAGRDQDAWWAEQDRKRREIRGH